MVLYKQIRNIPPKKFWATIIAIVVLAGLNIYPPTFELYSENKLQTEKLENKIAYQEKLAKKNTELSNRYKKIEKEKKEYEEKVFTGQDPDLLNSIMRSEIRNIANSQKIEISSMALPQFSSHENWLLITQEIEFTAPQSDIIAFINDLNKSRYYLPVIYITLHTSSKNLLRCSMKIVGFCRTTGTIKDNS